MEKVIVVVVVDLLCRQKYRFEPEHAAEFADFLLPMLHTNPARRISAAECLGHPWLRGIDGYEGCC